MAWNHWAVTMDVEEWLRSLALSQYEAAFRENAIDGKVLPKLTAEDLKELGVAIVGHRRLMLSAIAELAPAAPVADSAPPRTSPQNASPASSDAERRHLAVLFCDLVGSTEPLRRARRRGLARSGRRLSRRGVRGGHANSAAMSRRNSATGSWRCSAIRVAQENDAERAVRAALAIQRALAELNRKNAGSGRPELAARIGVETGAVVVDSAGEIFGDAPNIAARVQALAEPGTVLVTARVQRQVAGLFVAEDRGAQALKGVAGADDALPDRARERRRAPFGPESADAARRPRRRDRDAAQALGARAPGRGPVRA